MILAAAVVIIGVSALAPKLGVASPLLLVILGFAMSHLPGLPTFEVPPQLIFLLVLPPLLYATAVNVPTLDLRRNWGAISGLSVLLVLATSVVFGVILHFWLPGLGLAAGIAAGAVLSPTGAVATMVAKKVRAPHRLITMLEGEGLLNDAMALVVMRAAIAATAATVTFSWVTGNFLWLVAGGIICGIIVGILGIWMRRLIKFPELTTALTFVVPFAAFLAAESLNSSGEMAVVITGLFTGWAGKRYLEPQDRQYGQYNWLTIATMLEGALFFVMGLELSTVFNDTRAIVNDAHHLWLLAALSGAILLAIRAIFVFPLLLILNHGAKRSHRRHHHLRNHLPKAAKRFKWAQVPPDQIGPEDSAALRQIADDAYRIREHLGRKEGIAILWAGMRGAVTLAAAQLLPWDFAYRSLLVLLAAIVAAGTLLFQGFTFPIILRWLNLINNRIYEPSHVRALRSILKDSSDSLLGDPYLRSEAGEPYHDDVVNEVKASLMNEPTLIFMEEQLGDGATPVPMENPVKTDAADNVFDLEYNQEAAWKRLRQFLELRRRVYEKQHETLLDVLKLGTHDSEAISRVFDTLDADQMAVELRLEAVDAASE